MSCFNDVNVGDEVFVKVGVSYGWRLEKRFWVKASVDSVTPKQFTVGKKRFWKKNGKAVDSYDLCMKEGEKEHSWGCTLVKDQSSEMREFKEVLLLSRKAKEIISGFKIELGGIDLETIKTVMSRLTEIDAILNKDEVDD